MERTSDSSKRQAIRWYPQTFRRAKMKAKGVLNADLDSWLSLLCIQTEDGRTHLSPCPLCIHPHRITPDACFDGLTVMPSDQSWIWRVIEASESVRCDRLAMKFKVLRPSRNKIMYEVSVILRQKQISLINIVSDKRVYLAIERPIESIERLVKAIFEEKASRDVKHIRASFNVVNLLIELRHGLSECVVLIGIRHGQEHSATHVRTTLRNDMRRHTIPDVLSGKKTYRITPDEFQLKRGLGVERA